MLSGTISTQLSNCTSLQYLDLGMLFFYRGSPRFIPVVPAQVPKFELEHVYRAIPLGIIPESHQAQFPEPRGQPF
ncbi:hypothetical protein Hanom_Chr10g00918451 [Helianthus anomalus]